MRAIRGTGRGILRTLADSPDRVGLAAQRAGHGAVAGAVRHATDAAHSAVERAAQGTIRRTTQSTAQDLGIHRRSGRQH
jgi:hypothetical protein